MIDKSTITKAAQKLAARGQIDQAIEEWKKLLKNGKDGNIYNIVGDLHIKKGKEKEAVESFSQAADIFKKDGFYPKALALYKKIINIQPNDVNAHLSMAKLNAERGLTGDAIDHYLKAADIFNRESAPEKAVQAVEKVLHMSPDDINVRKKIAYTYFRLGHRERAANEYASIASDCLDNNQLDLAEELYRQSIEFDGQNTKPLLGMGRLSMKKGDTGAAYDYLQKAMSIAPDNREIIMLYATLSISDNRPEDAKAMLLKLDKAGQSDFRVKKILGNIYLNEGLLEQAWQEILPCIDDALDNEKWSEAHALLNDFKDLYPVPSKERMLRICRAQADEGTLSSELKELANLYDKEGRHEDALQLYREALEIAPDDTEISVTITKLEEKLNISSTPSAPPGKAELPEPEAYGEVKISIPEELMVNETPAPADSDQTEPFIADITSDDQFKEKKGEADFYAQQGLIHEAISIYHKLLSFDPGNTEIQTKINALSPDPVDTEEVVIGNAQTGESTEKPAASAVDDDLKDIFKNFVQHPEEKEDYDARYEAGLEYRQKGLMNEAIEELQVAARDPEKRIRNTTMLAMCFKEKGAYPLAIAEFNKIMDTMSPEERTYVHVKYELASSHMANKDSSRALELFSEIQAVNPDFKDVADILNTLKRQPPDDDNTTTAKNRVSYI
jgi:tetratricopeptide (TPR) repeat protein